MAGRKYSRQDPQARSPLFICLIGSITLIPCTAHLCIINGPLRSEQKQICLYYSLCFFFLDRVPY
jgi:hypothetical protein